MISIKINIRVCGYLYFEAPTNSLYARSFKFKIGTNYIIPLDNWRLFSKQKLLTRQFTRLCYIKV